MKGNDGLRAGNGNRKGRKEYSAQWNKTFVHTSCKSFNRKRWQKKKNVNLNTIVQVQYVSFVPATWYVKCSFRNGTLILNHDEHEGEAIIK